MSSIRALFNETLIYGIGKILPRILNYFVVSSYLTYRLPDTKDYAVYLDLYAYAALLIVFFSYRMDTAMFRFGKRAEDLSRVYTTAIVGVIPAALLVFAIGYGGNDAIATWLTYPEKGYYVIWFACIIAFDILNLLPFARMRIQGKALQFVSYQMLNVLANILLLIFFLEGSAANWLPAWIPRYSSDVDYVFMANLIASGLIFVIFVMRFFPRQWYFDKELWSRMARYAWPLILVGIAANINQYFGVPLQKIYLSSDIDYNKSQAGIYGAIQKIPSLLLQFTTAYNYAAEPFFFRHSEQKNAKQQYGIITYVFTLLGSLLCMTIISGMDIFQIIIGPSYRSAFHLIPILLLSYLFLGIFYNVSIWYKLSDQTLIGAGIAILGALITILGNIVLLPILGIDASAWIAMTCYGVMLLLALRLGRHYYPIEYPITKIVTWLIILVVFMMGAHMAGSLSLPMRLLVRGGLWISFASIIWWREGKLLKESFFP